MLNLLGKGWIKRWIDWEMSRLTPHSSSLRSGQKNAANGRRDLPEAGKDVKEENGCTVEVRSHIWRRISFLYDLWALLAGSHATSAEQDNRLHHDREHYRAELHAKSLDGPVRP
ncbi:MAG TPA: hypothetical protein VGZ22_10460 [Isosphaeraceae bacterium]|nr:hypothetical protein [Isosphaeraceae bacterium]